MTRDPAVRAAAPRRTGRASNFVREKAAAEGSERDRVRDALAARGLAPRRRFGQNFLIREDLAARIAEHCRLESDDVAIEIGPGAGALTPRLASRVRALIAIERDAGLVELLREEFADTPHLEIREGDFLETDLREIAREHDAERMVVVGNIPYNITTPILERLFEQRAVLRSAVMLVQKEYAERLAAAAGHSGVRIADAVRALPRAARAADGNPRQRVLAAPRSRQHAGAVPLSRAAAGRGAERGAVVPHHPRFVPDAAQAAREHHRGRARSARGSASTGCCARAGIDPRRRGETLTLDEFAKLTREAAAMGLDRAESPGKAAE